MRKHGRDNFFMEKLHECKIEELDYFEIKYIKEYDSIKCGYNVSSGGKVYIPYRPEIDENLLIEKYLHEKHISMNLLSKEFGVSRHIIRSILCKNNIEIINRAQPEVFLDINKDDLLKHISSGLSIRATAKVLGLPYPTVRKAIIYHNIEYNFSTSARHPKVMN